MSYHIPVFFFPIDQQEVPTSLQSWQSAEVILGARLSRPGPENGVRMCTSRNWWYQDVTERICRCLQLDGLGFLQSEIACIRGVELQTASQALENVLDKTKNGIPDLGPEIERTGAVYWLRHYTNENNETLLCSPDIYNRAVQQAQPGYDVDDDGSGFEYIVSFYSFIKTLETAVADAIGQDKYLLYIKIIP